VTEGNEDETETADTPDRSRIDFYRSQIVKYMWRLRDKDCPLKDAKKAQFYLGQLIQKLS